MLMRYTPLGSKTLLGMMIKPPVSLNNGTCFINAELALPT